MRTLILTCNTGEGHNSSARAIAEYFELRGEYCEVADALSFLSKRISKIVGIGHNGIYRYTPEIFDKGYAYSEKHSSVFAEGSLIYKFLAYGVKKLHRHIVNYEFDNVICVHPFAAMILSGVKQKYNVNIKSSLVATDYTCTPGTSGVNMDYYFMAHELICKEYASAGIPDSSVFTSGIPVRQSFFVPRDKMGARMRLGIEKDKKVIVMCCGSMGCGPIEYMAEKMSGLIDSNTMLIIICGSNVNLYGKLAKYDSKNIKIIGFTYQMCDYIDACDVYLTKPGGISTTEAVSKRVPMVFINAVAGCELRNREFFSKISCCVEGDSPDKIIENALDVLNSNEKQQVLIENLERNFKTNGAKIIFETLHK